MLTSLYLMILKGQSAELFLKAEAVVLTPVPLPYCCSAECYRLRDCATFKATPISSALVVLFGLVSSMGFCLLCRVLEFSSVGSFSFAVHDECRQLLSRHVIDVKACMFLCECFTNRLALEAFHLSMSQHMLMLHDNC